MNLKTATELHGAGFGSSLIGRKNYVVSTKYGNSPAARFPTKHDGRIVSGPYDNPEEAEHASQAMPYTRVSSQPRLEETPAVRDIVRKRMVQTNPDVDAGGVGSGRHKQILTGLGYKSLGKQRNGTTAELYQHPISGRKVLVHPSGAWATQKGQAIDNGTQMASYYSQYHPARDDQAVIRGR